MLTHDKWGRAEISKPFHKSYKGSRHWMENGHNLDGSSRPTCLYTLFHKECSWQIYHHSGWWTLRQDPRENPQKTSDLDRNTLKFSFQRLFPLCFWVTWLLKLFLLVHILSQYWHGYSAGKCFDSRWFLAPSMSLVICPHRVHDTLLSGVFVR